MNLLKKIILFIFSLAIGITLLIGVINRVGLQDIEQSFLVFKWWQALAILGLTFVRPIVAIWKWKEILKANGTEVPYRKIIAPFLSGFPFMFFFPMALMSGELFRGYALQKTENVPWQKTIGSIVVDRMLDWTVSLLSIFIGISIFLFKIGFPPRNISIIIAAVFIIVGAGVFFFYFKSFRKESMLKIFGVNEGRAIEVEQEIHDIFRTNWKEVVRILIPSLLVVVARLVRIWVLILFLGKSIGLVAALPFLAFYYLAVAIPIPAALGSHEVIQTFGFQSLGLKAGSATAFTMILRGAELFLALVGAAALFTLGLKIFKTIILEKLNGS